MRTYFECIPCFLRQALDSIRHLTDDETLHEKVLREALREAAEMDLRMSPPAMAQKLHRAIRGLTGEADPYRQRKQEFNQFAIKLLPQCHGWLRNSDDPLETAVRLALAGNVIDLGVKTMLGEAEVFQAIVQALSVPLHGEVEEFAAAATAARRVLYLADNAGEIVFDRLLIEQIGPQKITLAVRGAPVINDATRDDAEAAGLTEIVEVIDNGSDAPGTILEDCSPEFLAHFEKADLVIAKGQGNYESLSDAPRDVFFLLRAKCAVVARNLGCPVDSLVLRRSQTPPSGNGRPTVAASEPQTNKT